MDSTVSMAALTRLLEDHKAALSMEFKTTISALESKLDIVQTTLNAHGQRISSLETNADSVSDRLDSLEAVCAELTTSNAKLKAKAADLEARSRRNNIRIIGLPESIEGPQPTAFFASFLHELLGEDTLPAPPVLDRAHRSLAAKPKQGERPRPVIIRFHNFQTKEKVIREARKRRSDMQYLGKPIALHEDYTPEVMEQRVAYRDVMQQLYKQGLKPSLFYPARLLITTEKGERLRLPSVEAAKEYLAAKHA